jgi:hypothetical protein
MGRFDLLVADMALSGRLWCFDLRLIESGSRRARTGQRTSERKSSDRESGNNGTA